MAEDMNHDINYDNSHELKYANIKKTSEHSKKDRSTLKNLFQFHVDRNHRMIVVFVGLETKNLILSLNSQLSSISPLNKIIWTYKNSDTNIDKSIKKLKISENDTKLTKWIKMKDPQYINYNEINRVLGQTCDMLVIQDFEAVTPNMLAASLETARGGGLIVLLLDQEKSLDHLVRKKTELHDEIGCGNTFSPRFNKRLFKSLIHSNFAIFLGASMNTLDISSPNISEESLFVKPYFFKNDSNNQLLSLCKTEDQMKVLENCIQNMNLGISIDGMRRITAIKSARGCGKSVTLAFTVVEAIRRGASSIFIAALFLENILTLMEFVISGLEEFGFSRDSNLKVIYSFLGKKRLIFKIIIDNKQIVEYFNPFDDMKRHPNMLVIDEAASIPLDYLKKLLVIPNIYMATTVSGYEGTGRAFQMKLSDWFLSEKISCNNLELIEPIRYSKNDPVELWLNNMLLLNTVPKKNIPSPIPSDCSLFHVNKNALFSGSKSTEGILKEIFSLFISSHYRNSPNDIQLLSDSPNQEIFALLTKESPANILCAIQVSFEGRIDKNSKTEGNLIPWVLYENTFEKIILQSSGARIVRIAVHPNLIAMGYGRESLKQLENLLICFDFDNNPTQFIYNKHSSKILFNPLDEIIIPRVSWIGSSFGVTPKLLNFWKKNEYLPLCLKQIPSKSTGEFSMIVLKHIFQDSSLEEFIQITQKHFTKIFISLLGSAFSSMDSSLSLSIIYSTENPVEKTIYFDKNDLKRIELFVKSRLDVKGVIDLIPDLAKVFFYRKSVSDLNVLQQTILLLVGLQRYSIEETAAKLKIEIFDVKNILQKAVEKINKF